MSSKNTYNFKFLPFCSLVENKKENFYYTFFTMRTRSSEFN